VRAAGGHSAEHGSGSARQHEPDEQCVLGEHHSGHDRVNDEAVRAAQPIQQPAQPALAESSPRRQMATGAFFHRVRSRVARTVLPTKPRLQHGPMSPSAAPLGRAPAGPRDAFWLIAGQGVRAVGYGFTAVLLGALLAARGFSHVQVGVVLAALIAGTGVSTLAVGVLGDWVGRRRCYALVFLGVAVAGVITAAGAPLWLLVVVALTGTLSTDVVDNGPATTLEQVMLAVHDAGTALVYSRYNAIGAASGALGALGATLPGLGRHTGGGHVDALWFAVLVPVGLLGVVIASRLSPAVEVRTESTDPGAGGGLAWVRSGLGGPSRRVVRRLAGLFSLDAGGGGLVTTGFLSYFFAQRYGSSLAELGWLFFAVAVIQAGSVLVAPRLARRFGLITTMVGTHLPSNVLLASVAFAPDFTTAAALLLARTMLSQMDVPTRQALVMAVVTPAERSSAAAITNAARYTARPFGPLLAGAVQQLALGAPLLLAGVIKAGYDVSLWRWARHLRLDASTVETTDRPPPASTAATTEDLP
jgi:MFS family permease